jgi:hypothetical protein
MKFQIGPTASGPQPTYLRVKARDGIIGSKASLDDFLSGCVDLDVVHG